MVPFRRREKTISRRIHLRQVHKEALWKRSPRYDTNWLEGKKDGDEWWRCHQVFGTRVETDKWLDLSMWDDLLFCKKTWLKR